VEPKPDFISVLTTRFSPFFELFVSFCCFLTEKDSPASFRWTRLSVKEIYLLSVAICTHLCLFLLLWFFCLVNYYFIHGQSWIDFLLGVQFVFCTELILLYLTEVLEHSCLKKKIIRFALFMMINLNKIRLCNMFHLMATVSIVLSVVC